MAQAWFKNNKAAEKWTEDEIILMFESVLEWIEGDKTVVYVGEIYEYMMKKFSVVRQTKDTWINSIHIKNKRICNLWEAILQVVENRVVKDKEQLRPNIQAMVLQNKHRYSDKLDLGGQKDNPIQIVNFADVSSD